MQEICDNSKFFKAGNSFGLRLTKKDKQRMNAEPGDEYEKTISRDGKTIMFKKKENISAEMKSRIDRRFGENRELMDRLNDE